MKIWKIPFSKLWKFNLKAGPFVRKLKKLFSLNIAEIEAPSCNRTIGYRPQDMAMLSIWLGRERERERERFFIKIDRCMQKNVTRGRDRKSKPLHASLVTVVYLHSNIVFKIIFGWKTHNHTYFFRPNGVRELRIMLISSFSPICKPPFECDEWWLSKIMLI